MVFVSHDRYFIDKLSTRVFEIGEGRVEIFPGNYEDYVWRKQGGAAALQESVRQPEVVQPAQPVNGNAINTEVTTPEEPKTEKSKRLNPIKRNKWKTAFTKLKKKLFALKRPSVIVKLHC